MYLVPIGHIGKLDRQACSNWCIYNIGPESAKTWYMSEPVNSGYGEDFNRYEMFKHEGLLYAIAFYKESDALAFKLTFGL